jgi:AbrB family looped-hinge helix DNA binding protein
MSENKEELVKITSGGTISIPKQFRRFLELQRGDYVKVIMEQNSLIIKKAIIS